MIKIHRLSITLLLLFCYGCASTLYDEGTYWLERDNYDAAIQSLQEAMKENPDFQVKRELGIAFYKKKKYAQAQEWLQQAQAQNPKDGKTHLYLGLVYEAQEMYKEAMEVYQNFPLVGWWSRYRRQIEARFDLMKEKYRRKQIQEILANEERRPVSEIPTHTVAVMYFDYTGNNTRLRPLRKGITFIMIADLSKVASITVVEREQLQYLWDELKLAFSEGLEFLDRGELDDAERKFKEALLADSNFKEANAMLQVVEMKIASMPLAQIERDIGQEEFHTAVKQDILERTGGGGLATEAQLQPPGPEAIPERVKTQIRINF